MWPSYRAAIIGMDLQVGNAGLRSDTGWDESREQSAAGVSPLVGIGGGMLLVAGLGTALVLRPRRRTAVAG
ncbi:hypothetical protein [Blastococcus brunescens]|uniref:LPXTG cell wall anchor domain-containing protein n=1 Tax=Blastococcus brunescens TaxID=1564165 RepID=A0ABZ1B3G9_9ACTN|nr:hypothetical protein [Blastococcus sp. BMG 8361]WRL65345.1 hypothetical protein U6N30_06810 [Blastococcus sp. BMG 8361]